MLVRILRCWLFALLSAVVVSAATKLRPAEAAPKGEESPAVAQVRTPPKPGHKVVVYVVPIKGEIATPVLYILRRGLKEAIERKADVVVLDMKTPGGALDVTFDIMEALAKFPGTTITFVNDEAMSAGSFISATTDEIWFAPLGKIGAAAPVTSSGQDVDKTMKMKIVSYLKAEVRAISAGKGRYRAEVISAMIDENYVLKIDGKVLKGKGELLSLTATEASKEYGKPPQPLLAAGIAKNIDDLLTQKFGPDGYRIVQLEVTWSERLAVWLNAISPVLMGLGVICLIIEFKTPGFGFFGISGVVLMALVFLGNYVAGLSGHEPMILFAVGLLLLATELFFFPGVAVLAVSGVALMLGSLVWAMADIWPNQPVTIAVSGDLFFAPILNLSAGLLVALILGALLARFMPKGWLWDRMVLHTAVNTTAQVSGLAPAASAEEPTLIGREGVVTTPLRPAGEVEIDGRRYQARLGLGTAAAGSRVLVVGLADFGLKVEKLSA